MPIVNLKATKKKKIVLPVPLGPKRALYSWTICIIPHLSLHLTLKGTLGVFLDPGGMKSLIFSKRCACRCRYFRYSSLTSCLFKIMNQFHMGSGCLVASCGYMSGVFKDPRAPIGDFLVLYSIYTTFLPIT